MSYADAFPAQLGTVAGVPMSLMVLLFGLGLGLIVFLCEPRSPATRAQAFTMAVSGVTYALYAPAYLLRPDHWLFWALAYVPISDVAIMCGVFAWIIYVARAAQPTAAAMRHIQVCAALFAAATAWYFIVSVQAPQERFSGFIACMGEPNGCGGEVFWRYLLPTGAMVSLIVISMGILFTQKIDPAERIRVITWGVSAPFFFSVYIMPMGYNAFSFLIGYLTVMGGTMRYFSLRGERGVIMSRFLSPEVARLVRDKGLEHAVQPQSIELTVINCDLRGFTRFSQLVASDQVVRLLTEYYDTVGRAVAEFGATIKDYAGDGVLILVGAPIPDPEHAPKGLALAGRLRELTTEFIGHWAGPEAKLGIGIGVASGKVTVGAAGSEATRLEYTAVGPAVNLASRLCEQARNEEILVDARTRELASSFSLEPNSPENIKGFGEITYFSFAQ